ncbi:MAG: acyl-CoA dehydrogenase family protein, partial [Phycisphaerae bacterium]|nr:acyl-CoA dehydrogenase family protein [Gemmatimonadaceae bacterium]
MSLLPLTELQQEIQNTARVFAERELAPLADARDREQRFDRSMVQQLAELGFLGMMLPEQY